MDARIYPYGFLCPRKDRHVEISAEGRTVADPQASGGGTVERPVRAAHGVAVAVRRISGAFRESIGHGRATTSCEEMPHLDTFSMYHH